MSRLLQLQDFAQATMSSGGVQSTIEYALNPTDSAYTNMVVALMSAKNNYVVDNGSTTRILVTISDGTVIFDSSKSNNTRNNALNKQINENHMSRISIVSAALSQSGVAFEKKFSSSTGLFEEYLAHRLGKSSENCLGIIRWSIA